MAPPLPAHAPAPASPGAWTFTTLYFLESVALASVVTVLPPTVYAAFRDKETVSLVCAAVSLTTLGVSFAIPALVRRLSRRWAYVFGAGLLGLCAALIGLGVGWAAPLARTWGAAMLNVTLSFYIMDNIDRRALARSEPLRLGTATLAWSVGPLAGVWLMERHGTWAPSAPCLGAVALVPEASAADAAAAGAAMAVAFFAAVIDDLGPISFLRAVRPHERAAMAAVYRTYLDASELLPPLVHSVLFAAFGVAAAFAPPAAIGLLTLRHLPQGM